MMIVRRMMTTKVITAKMGIGSGPVTATPTGAAGIIVHLGKKGMATSRVMSHSLEDFRDGRCSSFLAQGGHKMAVGSIVKLSAVFWSHACPTYIRVTLMEPPGEVNPNIPIPVHLPIPLAIFFLSLLF